MSMSITRLLIAAALAVAVSPALAVEAPKLPASAKKLDNAGIKALYVGKSTSGTSYEFDNLLTFSVTIGDSKNTITGDWKDGTGTGKVNATYRIRGGKWCFKLPKDKEKCRDIYVDGPTIYEVSGKRVMSVNQITN